MTYIQFHRIAIVRFVQRRLLVLLSIATAAIRYTENTRINSTQERYSIDSGRILDLLIDGRDEIKQTDGARPDLRFVQFNPIQS